PTGIANTNVFVQWDGFIKITAAGSYTFNTNSDDGSQLFLDGAMIVTNDGSHGQTTVTSAAQTLSAGLHTLRVRYFQGTGGSGCIASYTGPDTSSGTIVIPNSVLFNATTAVSFTNNLIVSAGSNSTIDVATAPAPAGAGFDVAFNNLANQGGTLNIT